MLALSRHDLAANLAAFGETRASALVAALSPSEYERVCRIGFGHALAGASFAKAASLAAIEVIEGQPRTLRRSRRVWSDVPVNLLAPDPRMLEIDEWFARYSGGEKVQTPEILRYVSAKLGPSIPQFRYVKTARQFRHAFPGGMAYLGLEYAHGVMALRFGTRIDSVEKARSRLFGIVERPGDHFPTTIAKFSYNMGPNSRLWSYPAPTTWPILGTEGLTLATAEIIDFVDDIVEPYLSKHQEALEVRETLLHAREQADFGSPEVTVFLVDLMNGRRDWLDADYGVFESRYANYAESVRDELRKSYERVCDCWQSEV